MQWLARRVTTPSTIVASALVSFAVVLGCAIGAGELLKLAERPDGSTRLDSRITTWMVEHRVAAVTTIAHVFSTLGSTVVLLPLVAVVVSILLWRRQFLLVGLVVLAYGGSVGLYHLTKDVIDRQRPPAAIHLSAVAGSSFPSGHATQSLATYAALLTVTVAVTPSLRVPAWIVGVVVVAGVGWSRVYLGVHWATDVAAGWLVGAAWVTVVVWLAARARSPAEVRCERPPAQQ